MAGWVEGGSTFASGAGNAGGVDCSTGMAAGGAGECGALVGAAEANPRKAESIRKTTASVAPDFMPIF